MTRARRFRLRLSLRITLVFAVGALLVSLAVAVGAYAFTYRFVVRQQEHSALRQAYLNAATVRDRLRAPDAQVPDVVDAVTTGGTVRTVVYRSGRWYSSSLSVSRDALPATLRDGVLGGSVETMWTTIGGVPYIAIGVPLPADDGAYFQIFDESPLDTTLSTLRAVLTVVAAITTAAGAMLGWWASRRLTRPLREVSAAAVRIGTGDLDTRLNDQRDADLADLVASFNGMVASLRTRIERDARFAADVSHELRSPLTTLRTSLSVLTTRRNELSERGRDALDLLAGELERFQRLVEDLLAISRSDAATDHVREPVLISRLVLNVIDNSGYGDIPVQLDAEVLDAVVVGDKRRLEQAVRNLLDNAHHHAGGAVAVAVEPAGDCVRVVVDDAGPGIPLDERDRVFERFARGRNARRRGSGGGTGLGLALVAEHVRAHGGTVSVADRPGGGARVVVELPRERDTTSTRGATTAREAPATAVGKQR